MKFTAAAVVKGLLILTIFCVFNKKLFMENEII